MPQRTSPDKPRYAEESASSGLSTDSETEGPRTAEVRREEYECTPRKQEIARFEEGDAEYPVAKPVRKVIRGKVTHD